MGVFETFYARWRGQWLGGPRTKDSWGRHDWHAGFADAVGFSTMAAAEDAALKESGGDADFAILKAASAFTSARLPSKGADDLSLAVRAVCEARGIEADIQEAGRSRLEAAQAAKKTKARL